MKKAFAFSVYDSGKYWGGDRNKYTHNMIANIIIAEKLFPDWLLYIYYDDSLKQEIINVFKKSDNVVAIDMTGHWLNSRDKMLWRNLAVDDPELDVVAIRDCDGWLSYREKILIEEWLISDKDIHIIRDHCYHCHAMMGGIWAVRNHRIKNMEGTMRQYLDYNKKHRTHSSEDQHFLRDYIYKNYFQHCFVHASEQYTAKNVLLPKGYFTNENIHWIPKISFSKGSDSSSYYWQTEDEPVSGMSFLEAHLINQINCICCKKVHPVYIGAVFDTIPSHALILIDKKIQECNS